MSKPMASAVSAPSAQAGRSSSSHNRQSRAADVASVYGIVCRLQAQRLTDAVASAAAAKAARRESPQRSARAWSSRRLAAAPARLSA